MSHLKFAGASVLSLTALITPALGQSERKPGEIPGVMNGLVDLQDAGRAVFKLADENNDNQISQKEANDAIDTIVGGFFFRADKNGDGVLSQDEAKQAREDFLSTKPWVRYAVETGRNAKAAQQPAGQPRTASNSPVADIVALIDTNNDKQIQASELRQIVATTVQGLFAQTDANRDGQLSQAEVNAGAVGMARIAAETAFQTADADRNGQISQAEFDKAIIEPAHVAFQIVDLNHDGQLSPQEVQTARQVVMSRVTSLNMPEPANSPRNTVNSLLGHPTQPSAPGGTTAPAAPPASQPR